MALPTTYQSMKHLIGKTIGTLFVLDNIMIKNSRLHFKVKCICGKEKYMDAHIIKKAKTCGCKIVSPIKHGMVKSRTYSCWCNMKARCLNKNNDSYHLYGGRGIKIHENWLNFEEFLKDMGKCPEKYSIERINNNGNYEPGNCKWASCVDQANNKRNNTIITFEGKSQTLAQWGREKNIKISTLCGRLNGGQGRNKMSIEKALTKQSN